MAHLKYIDYQIEYQFEYYLFNQYFTGNKQKVVRDVLHRLSVMIIPDATEMQYFSWTKKWKSLYKALSRYIKDLKSFIDGSLHHAHRFYAGDGVRDTKTIALRQSELEEFKILAGEMMNMRQIYKILMKVKSDDEYFNGKDK